MSSDTVKWLIAREANCLRLAQYKCGNDKQGWMQDAQYFNDAHTALTTKTAELEAFRVEMEANRERWAAQLRELVSELAIKDSRIGNLEAELEACRRDALRYQWWRADTAGLMWKDTCIGLKPSAAGLTDEITEDELDAGIDRYRKGGEPG